uniref:Geranylgeranyl diphosphate synthase n=1 Tax=Streptomyces argenteolus TaxID=67274 RepID=A9ZNW2_9ACTN|nr:geranylgeranyl diphosphate synthase [Streptomyces argenteolus]
MTDSSLQPRAYLEEVRQPVNAVLREFIEQQQNSIPPDVDIGPAVRALGDFVLHGGKRIRAALCYWGWRGAGGGDEDLTSAYRAAAALEVCHCFGLIHDDIIDGTATRRGRPSLHCQLASLHEQAGWHGDAAAFGRSSALLMGDLCLFWADELLTTACSEERLVEVRLEYSGMRVAEVCGQMLEMIVQASRDFDVSSGMTVAHYKTAKYATERPLQIGGRLAGSSAELRKSYAAFGLPLGEAFQLRDDILGVFGDPAVTGKPITDDLREGKPTVLIAHAYTNATPAQRSRMDELYGKADLDEAQAAVLREIIQVTGARDAVEKAIEVRIEQSLSALDDAPIVEEARRVLADLSIAITDRDR